MADWFEINEGKACERCRAKRWPLLRIYYWRTPTKGAIERGETGGRVNVRAHCLDLVACRARIAKKKQAIERRKGAFIIAEPAFPDAPAGTCRWCGAKLTGLNASRRRYCYPTREGRDCQGAWDASRAWNARDALVRQARLAGKDLCCADCGIICKPIKTTNAVATYWEADHEIALEDGGEHALENLRCRCEPCHHAKTTRENRARAHLRRERPPSRTPQCSQFPPDHLSGHPIS